MTRLIPISWGGEKCYLWSSKNRPLEIISSQTIIINNWEYDLHMNVNSIWMCPPKFLCWNLIPQVTVLEGGAFGKPLAHEAVVVESISHVQLFVTPWTAAHQASLSFTVSWSLLKLMSIELVMLPNHVILCGPLLLFPSIRVFSNSSLYQLAKVLEFQPQHQSFRWIFRVDFLMWNLVCEDTTRILQPWSCWHPGLGPFSP